jgi:hypothetical protein
LATSPDAGYALTCDLGKAVLGDVIGDALPQWNKNSLSGRGADFIQGKGVDTSLGLGLACPPQGGC